jgi:hypothetical protein
MRSFIRRLHQVVCVITVWSLLLNQILPLLTFSLPSAVYAGRQPATDSDALATSVTPQLTASAGRLPLLPSHPLAETMQRESVSGSEPILLLTPTHQIFLPLILTQGTSLVV